MNGMKSSYMHWASARFFLLLTGLLFFIQWNAGAATITSNGTGNWNSTSTWNTGTVPTINDDVIIRGGFTVTVTDGTATCNTLRLGGTTSSGAGILTINASSTITVIGAVTVSGTNANNANGTINFNASSSTLTCGSLTMGNTSRTSASTMNMASGGVLTVNGTIAVAGTGTKTWTPGTGSVLLTANNTLPNTVFTSFNNLKIGSNTTTLGANITSVTGIIEVSSGATLNLSTYSIGSINKPTGLNMDCGGTAASTLTGSGNFNLNGNIVVSDIATGSFGATIGCPIVLATNSSFNVADGLSDPDLTVSGVISGAFSITKTGSGTFLSSGNNTYSGSTSISQGMLKLGSTGTATTGPLGSTGGITFVSSGASLNLNGYTLLTSEGLTLNGVGLGSSGALINSSATAATWSGTITLASDASIGTTGQITISNVISGGYGITKLGGNVLILSGANTYSGVTYINVGTVMLGGTGSGSNSPLGTIASNTIVANGACLDLNGYTLVTAEPLTLNGTGISSAGAFVNTSATATTYSGVVTMANASTISTTGNITLSNTTFNGGGFDLTKIGNGTLTFSTVTAKSLGALTISAGTFSNGTGSLSLSGSLSNSGTFTGSSATLSIIGDLTNTSLFTSTSGTCSIGGNFLNNGTFTHNNGTVVFNGSAPRIIDGNTSPTFYSLTLNNANGLTLNVSATINAALTLTAGRFTIGNFDLTIASGGSISGSFDANKMIVTNGSGKLVKALSGTSFTFPVGTGTTDYTPLTLSSLTGYTGKSVGVSVNNQKHANNASNTYYLNRYWAINPSTTGITGIVTGTFLATDVAGGDVTKVAAGRYFSTGTPPWTRYSALSGTTLTTTSAVDLGSTSSNTCFTGITLAALTASVNYNPGQNVLCGSTMTLTAAPVGDTPFTYLWSNNSETTAAITPSTTTLGTYSGTLTVTDANGFTVNPGYSYTVNAIQVDATLGTPTGYYTTLGNAFASINNGTHKGAIVAKIGYSTTETTTATLNASGGTASYTSVQLYANNPDIIVSGTINGALVSFLGADNVTINGSLLQTNSFPVLTFLNNSTGTSASTILFSQDACNNTISYCKLQGQGASASTGIVYFSTSAASGSGNDGNTISNNWITGTGSTSATRPYNAILSSGTSGRENNANIISNNRIYNFFNPANETNGIRIDANSTAFTITGNSFYDENAMTPTAAVTYRAIYLNNTSGVFNVQNNYIGGNAARASGTLTKNNNFNNDFYGIYLNVSGSTASTIQGNVIRNMAYNNTLTTWAGIYINAGKARIGSTVGDTIGNGVGTGSIVVTNTATGGSVYGIYVNSTDSVYIQNNVLGSITAANTNAANATLLFGIYKADVAGALVISNNKIGGPTTPNSLYASSTSTTYVQQVMGIYSGSTTSTLVQNNEISNLTNNTSGTGNNLTRGMRINGGMDGSLEGSGGSNTIIGNSVHDITSYSGNGSNYIYCQLVGIDVLSTNPGATQLIQDNKIFSLTNTITDIKIEMYGIFLHGSSSTTQIIDRNLIHTFNIISNTSAYLHGISVETGACQVTNNVVYLGNNITTGCSIWGLWTTSPNLMEFYHNTVYLTGTASTGTSNSFALRDLASGSSLIRVIKNNILWNERSNTNNNTIHYSLYLGGGGTYTINYNDYQFVQRFALVGGVTYNTFSQSWGSGYDANSLNVDPLLTNKGGSLASDYQPGRSLPCLKLVAEAYDFGYILRTDTATMGAWEYSAFPVEIWKDGFFQNGYANLKAAFDAINAGTYIGGLTVKIKANTTETATAVLYQSGYNGTSNYSFVTIHPTRTEIQVKGALTAPLVDLNGADNVRFDGRANLLGTTAHLMLINTSTDASASTLRFINSAESDTIQYCYLKGASSSATNGIVLFSTSTNGNGNDNDIISNCLLTNPGTTSTARVINAIYSAGTLSRENTGILISNNLFYDFRSLSLSSNGILISSNSSDFSITGNSFYQTATMSISAGITIRSIAIDNTSGNNFLVSGNFIGGSAQQCQGARLDIGTLSNQSIIFQPIYLNVGTTTATSVQGNTIANFQCYSTNTAPFVGIYLQAGRFNVGTVTGNVLGASTGTGNILLSGYMTSLASSYGIYINTTSIAQISNNTLAAITTSNSYSTANGHSFYAIYKPNSAGNITINDNVVGSLATAQSIQTANASTTDAQALTGIYCQSNGNTLISGNTVANLKNASTRSNVSNSVYGIWMQNIGTARDSIYRNFVCALSSGATASSTSYSAGIYLTSGLLYVTNNIVAMGYGETYYNNMVGIFDAGLTGQNSQIYHNTSYITGTNTNAVVASAFYKPTNAGTTDIRNNLFCNTSTGSNNKTYAMYFATTAGGGTLTANYNDYYTTGTVTGYYGGVNRTTKTIVTGQDVNSLITNPVFSNAYSTDRTGYRQTVDLFGTPLNVYIDHGSYVRSLTSPCMGAWERINKWKGSSSTNFNIAGNWTFNQVPSPGDNVIFDDVPLRPCLMDQERTVNNILNAQSAYRFILNGNKLNLLGGMSFTNGAQIDATVTGSTLSFAGSSVQTIPAGSLYNNTVYNLNLNNSSNVLLNSDVLHITGALTTLSTGLLDVISTSASIYFDGSSLQTIPAYFFKEDKVYNLRINNSANVFLSGTLKLMNLLTVTAGRLDAYTGNATFQYEGNAAQTIEPNCFLNERIYNLVNNNAAGLTLNSNIIVNNDMGIQSGIVTLPETKTLTVSGTLTNSVGTNGLLLKSSALGTASLIEYNTGVAATVQRYIDGDTCAWHFMSSPVSNQSISGAWKPSGTFGDGTGYDLYAWDEPASCWVYNLNTTVTPTWPASHPESYFVPGRGYLYAVQVLHPTKQFAGNLNSGTITRTLSINAAGIYQGFNLIGNPYPSSVNWKTSSGFDRSMLNLNGGGYDLWTWSTTANNYGVYNSADADSLGTNNVTQYIAPMQAFFVRATSAGTFAFKNDARVHNGAGVWLKSAQTNTADQNVHLSVTSSAGSDEVKLGFGYAANESGAMKLFSPVVTAPSLYMNCSGAAYSTRRLTDTDRNNYVAVNFKAGEAGSYTIHCNYDATTMGTIYLQDRLTDAIVDLSSGDAYTFQATTADAPERFVLYFGSVIPVDMDVHPKVWVSAGVMNVYLENMIGDYRLRVTDLQGRTVTDKKMSGSEQCSVSLFGRGMYIATIENASKKLSVKVVY